MESPGKIPGGREGAAETGMIAAAETEVECVYDTVAPLAPCYRRGAVIQGVIPSGRNKGPITLDAFQARSLGRALVEDAAAIDKVVTEAIRAVAKSLKIAIGPVKLIRDNVKSRFAPGLILDFPAHEFRIGSLVVRERTCVTVCYNRSASKIWVRFVAVGDDNAKFSLPQLADFFRFCEQASRAGIDAMRALYFEKFKAEVGLKTTPAFEEIGQIDFLGIDTDHLQFGEFMYTDDIGIVADASEIPIDKRHIFVEFFRENLVTLFPGRFEPNEIKGIAPSKVAVFRSEFSYRAIYHGIFRDTAVTFLVMSEPGRNVPNAVYKRESGALTVISELAARATRQF
jgi:hypothetical protein